MDANRLFKINQAIYVCDASGEPSYQAIILEKSRNTLLISEPASFHNRLPMLRGSEWTFMTKADNGLYYFNATVLDRIEGEKVYYTIDLPRSMRRKQRRRHVRLSCKLDIEYWIIRQGETGKGDEVRIEAKGLSKILDVGEYIFGPPSVKKQTIITDIGLMGKGYNGFTLNLSGGGIEMVSGKSLSPGSRLLLWLTFKGGNKGLMLKGEVLRVEPVKFLRKRCRAGVLFVDISESRREGIISYIFKEMRQKISKT